MHPYPKRVLTRADLVCYWFEKAGRQITSGKATRGGLVATNSIRGGWNLPALQSATDGHRIFEAWGDEPWVNDGAAVRVSLICFAHCEDNSVSSPRLDGQSVDEIHADLTANRNYKRVVPGALLAHMVPYLLENGGGREGEEDLLTA